MNSPHWVNRSLLEGEGRPIKLRQEINFSCQKQTGITRLLSKVVETVNNCWQGGVFPTSQVTYTFINCVIVCDWCFWVAHALEANKFTVSLSFSGRVIYFFPSSVNKLCVWDKYIFVYSLTRKHPITVLQSSDLTSQRPKFVLCLYHLIYIPGLLSLYLVQRHFKYTWCLYWTQVPLDKNQVLKIYKLHAKKYK